MIQKRGGSVWAISLIYFALTNAGQTSDPPTVHDARDIWVKIVRQNPLFKIQVLSKDKLLFSINVDNNLTPTPSHIENYYNLIIKEATNSGNQLVVDTFAPYQNWVEYNFGLKVPYSSRPQGSVPIAPHRIEVSHEKSRHSVIVRVDGLEVFRRVPGKIIESKDLYSLYTELQALVDQSILEGALVEVSTAGRVWDSGVLIKPLKKSDKRVINEAEIWLGKSKLYKRQRQSYLQQLYGMDLDLDALEERAQEQPAGSSRRASLSEKIVQLEEERAKVVQQLRDIDLKLAALDQQAYMEKNIASPQRHSPDR